MRINDLLIPQQSEAITILRTRCSAFLRESQGHPLIRNLSSSYSDFHKVKVRKRKSDDSFTEAFNGAFIEEHYDLRQRAIFANGIQSFQASVDPLQEAFYVFPVDGYKYMYSREVEHSGSEYKNVFEAVFSQLGDGKANEVLTDLLRFTYTSTNLAEGISHGAEIILYGIPYYYAVRASTYPSYSDLLTSVSGK